MTTVGEYTYFGKDGDLWVTSKHGEWSISQVFRDEYRRRKKMGLTMPEAEDELLPKAEAAQ